MFQSIIADIRREFKTGNVVSKLIIFNVCVWIVINLLRLAFYLASGGAGLDNTYSEIIHFFMVSSSLTHNLTHPWSFFTSIFMHEGALHLLFNMLYLFWFGRILGDLIGDKKVLPIYLFTGFIGCVVFVASMQLPMFGGGNIHYALGASGAVMGIVAAAAAVSPDYQMHLIFFGPVKLKFIAAILILLDLFAIGNSLNTGGAFAHLGGAMAGLLFVQQLRQGNDIAEVLNGWIEGIQGAFAKKPVPATGAKIRDMQPKPRKSKESRAFTNESEKLDAILEKIHSKGMQSLSAEEKKFLADMSDDK